MSPVFNEPSVTTPSRLPYGKLGPVRNRFAEELAEEVAGLREELTKAAG